MNAHAIDSPLKLLKTESMLTLQQLRQAVESYLEDPADVSTLAAAANSADQMRGVFTMLAEPDASDLMRETGFLIQSLANKTLKSSDALHEVLLQSALQAPRYFEWLQMEGNKPAFNLKPLLRQLLQVSGSNNKSAAPILSTASAANTANKTKPLDAAKLATKLRPSLQRALLGVLRGKTDSLEILANIFSKFKENATIEAEGHLWHLAEKLGRSILDGTLTLDNKIKLLLRDLDHHVKQLIEKGKIDQEAVQTMAQRLEERLPDDDSPATIQSESSPSSVATSLSTLERDSAATDPGLLDKDTLSTIAELLKESIVLAQDALDRFARDTNHKEALATEFPRLHDIANVLTLLNMEVPAKLIRGHISTLRQGLQNNNVSPESVLQVASELVLVQNILQNLHEFFYNEKMAASVAEQLDDEGRVALLMEFELKRAHVIIAEETIRIVGPIRTFATDCLTSDSEPDWRQLHPVFYHLSGTLAMLECQRAAEQVNRIDKLIHSLSSGAVLQNRDQFMSCLADLIVTFEHYLKRFHDPAGPNDKVLDQIEAHLITANDLISSSASATNASARVSDASSGFPDTNIDLEISSENLTDSIVAEGQLNRSEDNVGALNGDAEEPLAEMGAIEIDSLDVSAIFEDSIELQVLPEETYREDDDSTDFPDLNPSNKEKNTSISLLSNEFAIPSLDDEDESVTSDIDTDFDTKNNTSAELDDFETFSLFEDDELTESVPDNAEKNPAKTDSEIDLPDFGFFDDESSGEESTPSEIDDDNDDLSMLDFESITMDSKDDESEDFHASQNSTDSLVEQNEFLAFDDTEQQITAKADTQSMASDSFEPIELPENFQSDLMVETIERESNTQQNKSQADDSESDSESKTDALLPEQDPELLEIFFEEAEGEVVNIGEQVVIWRDNLADADALASLRRSFHTLKGSGRMVGEMTIGEFSWAFEQLLNRIIDGRLSPSYAIADAIEKARLLLDRMVEANSSKGYEVEVSMLIAEAEALLEGGAGSKSTPATETEALSATEDTSPSIPNPQIPELELDLADQLFEAASTFDDPINADSAGSKPVDAEPPTLVSANTSSDQQLLDQLSSLPPEADPELVEVFIYEAADILDSSEFTLQLWSNNSTDQGLMNNLRRDMHTLKGSSRMAGLLPIGDLAHAAESVLDAIAKGDMRTTSKVTDTLQQTLDGLSRMLGSVREGKALHSPDVLIRQLSSLSGDKNSEALQALQSRPIALDTSEKTDDQEFLEVFLYEATEILEASETTLKRWSSDPQNKEFMNDLRREMHTLKGSSRMAGMDGIGDAAQSLEELFDACLTGDLEPSATVLNSVQQSLDMLDKTLSQIKNDARPENVDNLIGEIRGLIVSEPTDLASKPEQPELIDAPEDKHTRPQQPSSRSLAMISSDTIRVEATLLNNLINQMGESSIYRARVDQGVGALRFNLNELDQTLSRLRQQMRRLEIETEAQILFRYEEAPADHKADFDPLELDRFAELQQLSRSLMEVVDDLTNIQTSLEDQTQNMGFLLDQQNKVNKDIQQGLMRTSMVRFSTVVPRLRRVVRQSAQELGKQAELIIDGSEAEVDRTVLDNMVAPLEHMLRNAISHGIEKASQRSAANKPEAGTIKLSLRREGAELVLELSDDGRGLDYQAIRNKGEANGLIASDQQASDQELIALLLRPGFSTATEVTQISGRGVGLDVLNDAIKTMRGALQIQSKTNQGTTFIIRLPFSLAVTQALLVKAGSDTFAIPMLSLEAVDRLKENEMTSYLEGETVQHEYGKHSYPLHSLAVMFGDEAAVTENNRPSALLFRSAEASAALQVDEIVGHQEIIVKPVCPQLHNAPGVSGATVLGDGRVVVVLELAALVRKLTSQAQQQMEAQVLRSARQEPEQTRITAMVIDDSITMRKVTARFLGRHNIDVSVAKDGIEAVAMLEEQVPDFAILDIEMPRMDGFEVVAHVRNQSHLKNLPIIMVTSRSGEKHRTRAARLGVNDYLIKPYQEEEMMASIQKVLSDSGLEIPL